MSAFLTNGNSTTYNGSSTAYISNTAGTTASWYQMYTNATTASSTALFTDYVQDARGLRKYHRRIELSPGENYSMPDGSQIYIDKHGNYRIDDRDAKVVYRANKIREFNRFINASDLLEAFIKEVGVIDSVKQSEILRLPIEAFINWIILGAAKQDGDSIEQLPTVQSALPQLPAPMKRIKPRCVCCGKFIRETYAAAKIAFCSPEHMSRQLQRIGA